MSINYEEENVVENYIIQRRYQLFILVCFIIKGFNVKWLN